MIYSLRVSERDMWESLRILSDDLLFDGTVIFQKCGFHAFLGSAPIQPKSGFSFFFCPEGGFPHVLIPTHNERQFPLQSESILELKVQSIKHPDQMVRHNGILAFLKKKEKKNSHKSIFLIGPLEEKRVRAEIHHADCWPCLRGATWGWCCVGFVRVLVVLDSVHVGWISGGKSSHSREQLITSVSHQPHCLQRDDK